MLLDVTIGGMDFKLVISSTGIPPSKFSVNYISRNNNDSNDNDNEKDAVVQLGDFSGSLYISKVEVIQRNNVSREISDISNDTGLNNSTTITTSSKNQMKRSVSSLDMYDVSFKTEMPMLPSSSMSLSENKNAEEVMSDDSFKTAMTMLPSSSMSISETKTTEEEQQRHESKKFPEGILGKRSSVHRRVSFTGDNISTDMANPSSQAQGVSPETLISSKDGTDAANEGDDADLDIYVCNMNKSKSSSESMKNKFGFLETERSSGNDTYDEERAPIKFKRRSISRRRSKTRDMSYSSILRSFNRKNLLDVDNSDNDDDDKAEMIISRRRSSLIEASSEPTFETAMMEHNSDASSYCFDSEDTSITGVNNIIEQISQKQTRALRNINRLHILCKGKKTKIKDLRKVLNVSPEYASYQDESGKMPLHWIASNEALYHKKKKGIKSFVNDLIKAYPDSIIALDDDNQMPFIAAIQSWVEQANVSFNMDFIGTMPQSVIQSDEIYDTILLKVKLTPFVEWAFQMLSSFIEARSYDHNNHITNVSFLGSNSVDSKKKIVENFCSMHNVLKTILLIDDDVIRCRILEMPLLQRSLLCTDLVSDWLVVMLRSNKIHSRAVDFFEIISNLTIQNAFDLKMKPSFSDKQEFITLRENMFRHISQLPGLITSLTILDKPDISRACSTYAIQRVLDFLMVNNSLIGMKFFDLSMNVLLIMSYHMHMNCLKNDDFQYENRMFDTTWPLIIWICIYFFLDNCLSSYFMMRSCGDFSKRYMNFWNFIETISIVASFLSTIIFFTVPSAIIAVTKGLLWLRFFSFLKGINMQLTTFVLAISKIISNLRWFLLLLGTMCFMFADMILTLSDNEVCKGIDPETDHDTIGDYCSQNFLRGILRAYAIIAGDIELNSYRVTPLITFLWVLFTLFGVIILLNVLIAIVTDSYERSFVERYHLFGKIRLPLLARHEFVKSKVKHLVNNRNCLLRCFCWAFLVASVILFEISLLSAIQYIWILPFASKGLFGLTSLLFGALANVSLIVVVLDFTEHNNIFADKLKSKWQQHIRNFFVSIMQTMIYGLLGIKNEADYDVLEYENKKFDGWINYLKFSTEEIVMNSEFRVLSVLRDFESRLEKEGLLSKP